MNNYKEQTICFVCIANYCRSPVAKVIAENIHHEKRNSLTFTSCGIDHLFNSEMDLRSINFLESKNFKFTNHIPRPITKKILNDSDTIFAMDYFILDMLNKKYSSYSNKFKLFTYLNPKIIIKDPYKLNDNEYYKVMDDIYNISQLIKF